MSSSDHDRTDEQPPPSPVSESASVLNAPSSPVAATACTTTSSMPDEIPNRASTSYPNRPRPRDNRQSRRRRQQDGAERKSGKASTIDGNTQMTRRHFSKPVMLTSPAHQEAKLHRQSFRDSIALRDLHADANANAPVPNDSFASAVLLSAHDEEESTMATETSVPLQGIRRASSSGDSLLEISSDIGSQDSNEITTESMILHQTASDDDNNDNRISSVTRDVSIAKTGLSFKASQMMTTEEPIIDLASEKRACRHYDQLETMILQADAPCRLLHRQASSSGSIRSETSIHYIESSNMFRDDDLSIPTTHATDPSSFTFRHTEDYIGPDDVMFDPPMVAPFDDLLSVNATVGLHVDATLVEEMLCVDVIDDTEVDQREKAAAPPQNNRTIYYLVAMVLTVAIIAAVAVILWMTRGEEDTASAILELTAAPTIYSPLLKETFPSIPPSMSPSSHASQNPTLTSFELIVERFTTEVGLDRASVSIRALTWLVDSDPSSFDLATMDINRLVERYAVVAYFFAIGRTTPLFSPVLSERSVCNWNFRASEQWRGVFCNDGGSVTAIVTTRFTTAEGTVPTEVGLLSDLKIIYHHDEPLSGTIPSEIGKLSLLQAVTLSATKNISGKLPSELGQLVALETLIISNYATILTPGDVQNSSEVIEIGVIPTELGLLTNLTELTLNNMEMGGSKIPSEIGQLPNLMHLLLQNNNLVGTVPVEVQNLRSLEILSLRGNNLHGNLDQICTWYGNGITNILDADCFVSDSEPLAEIECSCCTFCCRDSGCLSE